jgi:hypothetical protein
MGPSGDTTSKPLGALGTPLDSILDDSIDDTMRIDVSKTNELAQNPPSGGILQNSYKKVTT